MNGRIEQMVQAALSGHDLFPTGVPEAPHSGEDLKNPVEIGKGIYRFLAGSPVEVYENERIVGRIRFSGCGFPADYYTRCGHENTNRTWNQCCFSSHPNDLYYWGWTHLALDYGYILRHGLRGYLKEIADIKTKHANDSGKLALLEGMEMSLRGVVNRCGLYARKCREFGTEQFAEIAKNCEKVPLNPAETFYEAVQSVWSCFLMNPDSLGRVDQYLYPYYIDGIRSGALSKESALELLEELFVKVYESQMNNTALPISGHNHLVVGGYLENGEDGFNELSKLVLEAIAKLPTYRPQASFRYTQRTTPETMRYITELNIRCPLIVFVNDEPRIRGMVDAGIEHADAVNYTVVGCNEWSIAGRSKLDLAHVNLLHPLCDVLYNRTGELLRAEGYDEVYWLFEQSLKCDILSIARDYEGFFNAQAKDVNVLTSALMIDCIQNALSYTSGGTRYYGLSMSFNSISNAADSLSVIKQFVFDEKLFSMGQLLHMIKNNWRGYEAERAMIQKRGRFFGNDDDYADKIACDIVDSIYLAKKSAVGGCLKNIVVGSFVGATHPSIVFGSMTRATPDGRYDGEEFTMGISQSQCKDKKGLTALLNSIAKLDYRKFCGCIVSNIKLDKQMADMDEKLLKLSQIYHTFLKLGGMQLQINYLSTDELKMAQNNPDRYSHLMVRVTGYSGFFTLFDKALQDDIIKQTEYKSC